MIRLRLAVAFLGSIGLARTAAAQVVTWGGGFPDDQFSVASNWLGGVVPLGGDAETLQFTNTSDSTLSLNTSNVAFGGILVSTSINGSVFEDVTGTHSLTLGAGGVAVVNGGESNAILIFDVPLALSANQAWSQVQNPSGFVEANGTLSGNYSLQLAGDTENETFVLTSGASTFSGGVTVAQSNTALLVGASTTGPAGAPTSGPVGTGTLVLGDGTTLSTTSAAAITLANALTVGDQTNPSLGVTFGGNANSSSFGNGPTNLVLTGPVLLNDFDLEIDIAARSTITFAGALTGYTPGVCLDFGTTGQAGTSFAIVQGGLSNVDRLDLEDGVSVIFNGSGPSQVTGLGDIGVPDGSSAYLGFGSAYASAGSMTSVLSFLNSTSASNISGTLGFDTITGPTAVFNDPINLVNFTNGGFVGLGSATQAILGPGAVITPPANTYLFGGGGGTLTVESSLGNGESPRGLDLQAGNAPLTLILSTSAGAAFTYTGATSVSGAALIFDAPLPTGPLSLGHGYIGVTPGAGFTDGNANIQQFVSLFNGASAIGVIGFDSLTGPQTIASPVDMSEVGPSLYLGSATNATYTGDITPNGTQYKFAGVKGASVTVASTLSDNGQPFSVTIGLPAALESFNPETGVTSISTVTLSGANTYTGGTTLYSGNLVVTNSSSLGSGPLVVSASDSSTWVMASLSTSGGPVTLGNRIVIAGSGLALNSTGSGLLTLTGNIINYPTQEGSLSILGPVTLSGNNTYSGTTNVQGAALTVASNHGLGNSFVAAVNSTLHFTSANPQLSEGLNLSNSTATFDGSPILQNVQLAESTLAFNGATAVINGLDGDSANSNNVISLGAATALTLDDSEENGGNFHGSITGSATSSVLYSGEGGMNMAGTSTYGGGTTVEAGVILIASSNSAFGTGPVTVSSGAAVVTNTGVTVANPISLADGSGMAGFGTFSPGGNLTFENGSILDPGIALINSGSNSALVPGPGKLTFGGGTSLTFASGGSFIFSVSDASGSPGVGYSSVDLGAGALTLTNTGNPFDIQLYSFDPATNLAGMANNFNPGLSYSWTLVSAGSISGFNANFFTIDPTHFQNTLGAGSFFVSTSGNDLMLNFTPVPEPSTWALMASGLCTLGAVVRRRRR